MHNTNLSAFILLAVGVAILIFTYWNRVLLKRYLKAHPQTGDSLADPKYFELKSKQDYIIAVSAIIVSLATFFGYQGLQSIKDDLNAELKTERASLDNIKLQAQSAIAEYQKLKSESRDYSNDLTSSKNTLSGIKAQINSISAKNIIQRSIYLVDGLKLGNFQLMQDSLYFYVPFNKLKTYTGDALPVFKNPPVVFITASDATPVIRNITTTSFEINAFMITGQNDRSQKVRFDLMIMSKELN